MVIKIISPTKAYISGSRASKSSSGLCADHMEADVVISGNNVTEKGTVVRALDYTVRRRTKAPLGVQGRRNHLQLYLRNEESRITELTAQCANFFRHKRKKFRKKVVSLQPKGCENGLRLSNSNKFDCVRLAPSLHAKPQNNKEDGSNYLYPGTSTSVQSGISYQDGHWTGKVAPTAGSILRQAD